MREIALDIEQTQAYTKDNVAVIIEGCAYIRFRDPERVCYKVSSIIYAVKNLITSSARTAVGKMDIQELINNRDAVKLKVKADCADVLKEWGTDITRFEITALEAADRMVKEALKKVMTAERERKEIETHAQANFEQVQKEADGMFYEISKKADALAYTMEKEAEGDYSRVISKAEAEKESITMMCEVINQQGGLDVIKMRLAQRYIKILKGLSKQSSNNTIVMPLDVSNMGNIIDIGDKLLDKK